MKDAVRNEIAETLDEQAEWCRRAALHINEHGEPVAALHVLHAGTTAEIMASVLRVDRPKRTADVVNHYPVTLNEADMARASARGFLSNAEPTEAP